MHRYTIMRERDDGDFDHIQVVETKDSDGVITKEESVFEVVPAGEKDFPWGRPDPEVQIRGMKEQRNELLQYTDWTQLPDVNQRTRYAYVNYRQALRDITSHENWPNLTDEDWPNQPNL